MTESSYQRKIASKIEAIGGHWVNGNYTRNGEADLQCGYPIMIGIDPGMGSMKTVLLYLAVEVKTEKDYHRVMKGVDENYNIIDEKKMKPHEFVQMAKIRAVRNKGGLALVCYKFEQIQEYINEEAISQR